MLVQASIGLVGAVSTHQVCLPVAVSTGVEGDLCAVGKPGSEVVLRSIVGEEGKVVTVGLHELYG